MSYKRKTLICLVILLLSGTVLLYAAMGYPALTPEMAFRRWEKQQLVGPAEILDTLTMEQLRYDRITIGKSDWGYSLYHWNDGKDLNSGLFTYHPKDGSLTIVDAPLFDLLPYVDNWQYPIFAFTDQANATRAVLTLQLSKGGSTEHYELEAERQFDCCFLFTLEEGVISKESFQILYAAAGQRDCTAEICVTLYDRNGTPLESKTLAYDGEVANA